MQDSLDALTFDRVRAAYERARSDLLAERNDRGQWTGELSTSALSTATAVMALVQVARHSADPATHSALINGGLTWLAEHQNDDGGWGDTTKSFSNISTTMLCQASFHVKREEWSDADRDRYSEIVERATSYIDAAGGTPAMVARYGKDKTFSVPILTHCALAGLVEWSDVQQLPFEMACLPAKFYKIVQLPVVSYALPALIAIGQVRHHFRPTKIPGLRLLRNAARRRSLDVLQRIQPSNGGFLEAAPLTSFVTMSLAGMGKVDHPVVKKGVEFLVDSVREDGSWPIDTNLATWVTTLSVNALGPDLPDEAREPILRWLLKQQFKEVHPFTNADPGGWSWTDLPGGVPDADDTPGAILAILELVRESSVQSPESSVEGASESAATPHESPKPTPPVSPGDGKAFGLGSKSEANGDSHRLPDDLVTEAHEAIRRGVRWLLNLQNRDGGWPTFCRGWGKLPFDRSSPDITAHCLRAIGASWPRAMSWAADSSPGRKGRGADGSVDVRPWQALFSGFHFLRRQRLNGQWLPLWFGNQHQPADENPVYGTSRVLACWRTADLLNDLIAREGVAFLIDAQNPDGGFGGDVRCPSSVEETALAVEVLLTDPSELSQVAARRGVLWLIERVEDGTYREPTPIGFYFAKLWYFERLYPLIFTVAALRRAVEVWKDAEDL